MSSLATFAYRVAVVAAGMVGLAMASAPANAQDDAPPVGWYKACQKQQDVDICNVQNIVLAQTGQLITGVSLIEIRGKIARRVLQVIVPTGRLVPPGIGMQIDDGKMQKIDYVICLQDRCIAEAQLTDALVASLKKGTKLTLTSVNFQNQPNPISLKLEGFKSAYDGAPIQQSDLEDRQKKLQDFVAKNNDDFAKKLKEEQQKAKNGD